MFQRTRLTESRSFMSKLCFISQLKATLLRLQENFQTLWNRIVEDLAILTFQEVMVVVNPDTETEQVQETVEEEPHLEEAIDMEETAEEEIGTEEIAEEEIDLEIEEIQGEMMEPNQ